MESDVITLQDIFRFDYSAGPRRVRPLPRAARADRHPPEVRLGPVGPRRRAPAAATSPASVAVTSVAVVMRPVAVLAIGLVAPVMAASPRRPARPTRSPSGSAASPRRLGRADATGVLTLRSRSAVQVDANGSLRASIDGRAHARSRSSRLPRSTAGDARHRHERLDGGQWHGDGPHAQSATFLAHRPGRRPRRRRHLCRHGGRRPRPDPRPQRPCSAWSTVWTRAATRASMPGCVLRPGALGRQATAASCCSATARTPSHARPRGA